jgi:hypothetical protein
VTVTNRIGQAVSWRDLRRWALAGSRLWLPSYLRDAERHEGLVPPYCALPASFRPAPDVRKWPEEALPSLIIVSPGLTDSPPVKQADRSFQTEWIVAFSAVVHGKNEAETELMASCYGVALRLMVLQQAGDWATLPGYVGPSVGVDSIIWEDEGYDEIPASRSRTLVAATVTFTIVFRNTATSLGGPIEPPVNPITDPGPWPEVLDVELDIEREAIS